MWYKTESILHVSKRLLLSSYCRRR